VEEVRSFEVCELFEVATVWVASESGWTGVPQERQKRLFSGRSLEHLRHFVDCMGLRVSLVGLERLSASLRSRFPGSASRCPTLTCV